MAMMTPGRMFFPILTGNYGVEKLCNYVYRRLEIHGRIGNLSKDQLTYVVLMCHAARCYYVASALGYNIEIQYFKLIEALKYLRLPSIICEYIESIGCYQFKNSIKVVPWVASRDEFYDPKLGQLRPEDILKRAGRVVPDNYWKLDREWIIAFNLSVFPYLESRNIRWENTDGNAKMIITPKFVEDNYVKPTSSEACSEDDAQLGALYNFRRLSERSIWPGYTKSFCNDIFWGRDIHVESLGQVLQKMPDDFEVDYDSSDDEPETLKQTIVQR